MENETNYILSAGDMLSCQKYQIPDYQRPYVWSEDLALGLFSSIKRSFENGVSDEILLGHIILHVEADAINIVDGQQRITTLALILKALGDNNVPFLDNKLNILSHKALKRNFELLKLELADTKDKERLVEYIKEKVKFTFVKTEDLDEAFLYFDTHNTSGRALSETDLLKNHHLMFMDETKSKQLMLHYTKKWNEYSLCGVNTSWFLRENLIFRTLRTALTIRNIKTNAYYPHIVFGYYGADEEWYRINYSIFQEFKNHFDEKIKIYKSNISIVDDVLGGANFFEYVFKYCDILKYIESSFIFFNGDFTGCSYLNHACHVVLLCVADKFGTEALDEISDLVLFNVLIVVCKHDRIDPNNYMLSNLTNRLLQLIDTSSVLETLKIKIEKELKSNVDTVYISPEKLKKLKNKDKYTENYIKSRSFGIIKLKGKEDGSKKK
ncbi:hypothetical protein B9N66_02355 [Campylobacter concisus]|uniref:DUF262 domain-containing protein n=1 Tax=Campylobacter concisus TaxID=199 RepID=UPI000B3D6BF7|nr:DUF262 domain-containing protein [Campylobacter concisus]OUT10234.1 hypothetical protein B9N66_02355 [Campylobacter concisus]